MSPNLTVLLLTRGLVGFGVTSSVVAFSLFTEFLPLLQRGRYLLLIELFWTAGTVLEVGLAWMILPSIGWRWLLFISAIPIVLGAALSKLIPESPRYLLVAGQPEKALSVFRRAADANKSTLPEGSLLKRPPSTNRGSIKAFFTRDMMRMLVPLFLVWFANAFLYYGLILFTSIAIASDGSGSEQEASPTDSSCQLSNSMYLSILITTLSEVPGLLISVWLLDRVGRKKTMAGGLSVTSVCFFLVLIPLGAVGKTFVLSVGRAAIYGAFCVVYVYTPEVFPTTIRSLGLGACSSFARFGGILSPIIANGVLSNSLWLPVALYGSCAFCASVAAMLLPVETTGVALREETLVVDVLPSRENSSKQELDQEALLAESV
jgi:MFS family permease